ncbi:MAG: hypothetical protein FJ225_07340 [Lentisphaerae bacterium]|nr:hypothetical protein [Lentisphaerota bacterium]
MSRTDRFISWRIVLITGLVAFGIGTTALAAQCKAPAPDETPVAVVADAAAARAALDKARASGQALIANVTLGHEGQLVRAKTAEALSPGRYRLHVLAACTAKDEAIGEGVVLRLTAGGSQGVCDPGAWIPRQAGLAAGSVDFIVDKSGQIPIAVDWGVRDSSKDSLARRQNAINQLSLKGGPGAPQIEVSPADAGLGADMDDLLANESTTAENLRLAPRALAGEGLPPYRLMFAGLVIERLSPVVKVRIDGRECVASYTSMGVIAGFDLAQAGKVELECKGPVQGVDVRPKSLGIRPEVAGNKVTLPLKGPASLSVEIDGDIKEPLFLFADPPDPEAPKPDAPGVKFFAAGKFHDAGRITVKSDETVYIERGAVVRGSIFMDEVKNVKILGRGIIEGGTRPIEIRRAEDVLVEGVTLLRPAFHNVLESRHWTIPILRSDRVTVRGVKVVSENRWDDGVVVVGSRDVTVEKCFFRTQDSCVAIKAGGVTYFTQLDCQRDVENVAVRECVLWNGPHGNGLEIHTQQWLSDWMGKQTGFEPRVTHIRKVRFTNNDLIHGVAPGGAFAIRHGDQGTVGDVICEDLRVEDPVGSLVDFKILPSPCNRNAGCGLIRGVVVRNIRVEGKDIPPSVLSGFDETHPIEGVVFENVQAGGRKWTKLEDGAIQTKFVTGVEFR